jgi:cytochrome bd-type quinol oxidase subunit 1
VCILKIHTTKDIIHVTGHVTCYFKAHTVLNWNVCFLHCLILILLLVRSQKNDYLKIGSKVKDAFCIYLSYILTLVIQLGPINCYSKLNWYVFCFLRKPKVVYKVAEQLLSVKLHSIHMSLLEFVVNYCEINFFLHYLLNISVFLSYRGRRPNHTLFWSMLDPQTASDPSHINWIRDVSPSLLHSILQCTSSS